MGCQPPAANSRDGALGVCVRNFIEHAIRCRRDIAWLSRARRHDFFRWVSTLAPSGGHGVLPSSLLSRSAYCGPASFRATEHDWQRGFLRDSVGLGVDFAILTIGAITRRAPMANCISKPSPLRWQNWGRAVFFGALTTAVGFLALVLSGAMSFSELGVLIAIGIFVAGLFMCSILFLFVHDRQGAVAHSLAL